MRNFIKLFAFFWLLAASVCAVVTAIAWVGHTAAQAGLGLPFMLLFSVTLFASVTAWVVNSAEESGK